MTYYIAHTTPRATNNRREKYKTKESARQMLRFIRSNCRDTNCPAQYLGKDCLEVSIGGDRHYYNILKM